MKLYLLPALLFYCVGFCYAQDKLTYLNINFERVKSKDSAEYIREVFQVANHPSDTIAIIYYMNGNPYSQISYSDFSGGIKNGYYTLWFPTGCIKEEATFGDNIMHGLHTTFWGNGVMKRREVYINDVVINGACFDSLGNQVEFYPYWEMPEFPGGMDSMYTYLSKNIVYPELVRIDGIQGRVLVSFQVSELGKIDNVKLKESLHPLLDQQALYVISHMPDWKPGYEEGEPIRVAYTIPVRFELRGNDTLALIKTIKEQCLKTEQQLDSCDKNTKKNYENSSEGAEITVYSYKGSIMKISAESYSNHSKISDTIYYESDQLIYLKSVEAYSDLPIDTNFKSWDKSEILEVYFYKGQSTLVYLNNVIQVVPYPKNIVKKLSRLEKAIKKYKVILQG